MSYCERISLSSSPGVKIGANLIENPGHGGTVDFGMTISQENGYGYGECVATATGTGEISCSPENFKILEDAGLVASRKDGLWVNYALTDGHQSPFAANLLGNIRHWLNDDPEITALLEALPDIDRCEILGKE